MPLHRRRRRARRLVRVHAQSGPSLEGLCAGRRGDHYLLERAKLLEGPGASVELEGWVEIPARNVLFVQVLAEGLD